MELGCPQQTITPSGLVQLAGAEVGTAPKVVSVSVLLVGSIEVKLQFAVLVPFELVSGKGKDLSGLTEILSSR